MPRDPRDLLQTHGSYPEESQMNWTRITSRFEGLCYFCLDGVAPGERCQYSRTYRVVAHTTCIQGDP